MSISWRILIKYMAILLRSRFNEYKVFYSTPMTVVNEHIKKLFVWGLGIIEASSRDFSMGNWLTAYGQQKFCGIFFFLTFLKFSEIILKHHHIPPPSFHTMIKFIGYYFWSILLHISECISVFVTLEINIRIKTDYAKP